MVDNIRQDVRYALRLIRLNASFSIVAILSLALGAGANTAMFQLLDAVRLRTLPVHAPNELIELRVDDMTHARGSWLRDQALTNPLWERIRQEQRAFAGAFAWADEILDVSTAGEARKINGLWVSGDFFRVLGVRPIAGRVFDASDDRRGCGLEAGIVLSDRFWQQQFGGDRAIVGRPVSIGRIRTPVVGVAPPAFHGLEVGRSFDIAMPICAEPAWHGVNARLDSGTVWWLTVMGRVGPGGSVEQAAARMRAQSASIFAATLPAGYPAASVKPYLEMTLAAVPASRGRSQLRALYSRPLVLLVAITALVLLIACVNLAHLMLARASGRGRELAVRVSLGASGRRLAQQLVTESFVLAIAGVALGLLLARMLTRLLLSLLAGDGAGLFLDVSMNGRTFGFAAALAILTCAVFASLPARRAATLRPAGPLRSATPGGAPQGERSHLRRTLLASQIALSLALLAGALLFVQSLRNLQDVDAGFQPRGIVIADINFSDLQLASDRAVSFRRELLDQIRGLPGVDGAAEALMLPLAGGNWNNRVWMETGRPEEARVVMRNMIGAGYFRTMRTTVRAGRDFDAQDMAASAAKVAIVNERFTREFGLGPRAIGRHFSIEPTPLEPSASYEIVGVVSDTKYHDLREADPAIIYVPLWPAALRRASGQFVIRSGAPTGALIAGVRTTLDRLGPIRYAFRAYDAVVERSLLRERLMATLGGPFAGLAVILTALGLYGVFSYTVTQRTRDIGIRIALGANRGVVIRSVLREATIVVAIGLLAGGLLVVAVGRAARSLLFGLTPSDPVSLATATVLLAVVAAVASYLPARRAASIEPAVALRHD